MGLGISVMSLEVRWTEGSNGPFATEAPRELTGKGQCTAKRGAHVYEEHVIL